MTYAYAVDAAKFKTSTVLSLDSPTLARPKVGAYLILFERKDKDILFTAWTQITAVSESIENKQPSALTVSAPETFDKPRSRIELAGSLQRTKNYLNPSKQFRLWLVALTRQDYNTIHDNEPAVGRSVFRMLFHALPLALRAEFVRRAADMFPDQNRRNFDYFQLAYSIVDFIQVQLAEPVELVNAFVSTYPSNIKEFPLLKDLWLTQDLQRVESPVAIPFGADAIALQSSLTSLFQPVAPNSSETPNLLQECLNQLRRAEDGQERFRSWNDPIF